MSAIPPKYLTQAVKQFWPWIFEVPSVGRQLRQSLARRAASSNDPRQTRHSSDHLLQFLLRDLLDVAHQHRAHLFSQEDLEGFPGNSLLAQQPEPQRKVFQCPFCGSLQDPFLSINHGPKLFGCFIPHQRLLLRHRDSPVLISPSQPFLLSRGLSFQLLCNTLVQNFHQCCIIQVKRPHRSLQLKIRELCIPSDLTCPQQPSSTWQRRPEGQSSVGMLKDTHCRGPAHGQHPSPQVYRTWPADAQRCPGYFLTKTHHFRPPWRQCKQVKRSNQVFCRNPQDAAVRESNMLQCRGPSQLSNVSF